MSVKLEQIIPWGRTLREYELMFGLSDQDLPLRILGCGDGPASFNAQWTARGGQVISADPIYELGPAQIQSRFDQCAAGLIDQVKRNLHNYVWKHHRDPDHLLEHRRLALRLFLADFPSGRREGRYIVSQLPHLPFPDNHFDLALSSHLLFLYSDLLDRDFHIRAIRELCRVSREVRIFPLTSLDCELSGHLPPVLHRLQELGLEVVFIPAGYQIQRNGTHLMRIARPIGSASARA